MCRYSLQIEGHRRTSRTILSKEELLRTTIREIPLNLTDLYAWTSPTDESAGASCASALPRRVCARWNYRSNCFFPGTIKSVSSLGAALLLAPAAAAEAFAPAGQSAPASSDPPAFSGALPATLARSRTPSSSQRPRQPSGSPHSRSASEADTANTKLSISHPPCIFVQFDDGDCGTQSAYSIKNLIALNLFSFTTMYILVCPRLIIHD